MLHSTMIWNEPNNKSHWDIENDPGWVRFGAMAKLAGEAIGAENAELPRVLGGISPIDPGFLALMRAAGALDAVDAVAVHGFPLDWNLWKIDEWPSKVADIRVATGMPVWVSEVGVSSFGADEVQEWGLARTAALLRGQAERVHWYSLYDLPSAWPATTRHKEAEGSSYYRHFHMGLFDEHGQAKAAGRRFAEFTPELGICQWFHFEDPRLEQAVADMRALGVRHLRTGLSWADWARPGGEAWCDRMMRAIEPFEVTATFCFTPEDEGIWPHHTSPPREPGRFAEFCALMVRRYGG